MDLSAALNALAENPRAVTRSELEDLARGAGLEAVVLEHEDAVKTVFADALRQALAAAATPPTIIDVVETPAHPFAGLPEGAPVLTPSAQPATPSGEAAPPPLPPASGVPTLTPTSSPAPAAAPPSTVPTLTPTPSPIPAPEVISLPPSVPRGAGPEALRSVAAAPPLAVGGVPVLTPDRPAMPTGSAGLSVPVLRPAEAQPLRAGGVPVLTPDGGDALTVCRAVLRRSAADLRAVADRVVRETPHRAFAYWVAGVADALERAAG